MTTQQDQEREAFEREYTNQYPISVTANRDTFERDVDGDYIRTATQVGWVMWRAVRAAFEAKKAGRE